DQGHHPFRMSPSHPSSPMVHPSGKPGGPTIRDRTVKCQPTTSV
ncbi:jg23493, partial [Pararge aegeria aegeria]